GFFGSYSGSGMTLNTPREPGFSTAISRARRRVASRSTRGGAPGSADGSSTLSLPRMDCDSPGPGPGALRGPASGEIPGLGAVAPCGCVVPGLPEGAEVPGGCVV